VLDNDYKIRLDNFEGPMDLLLYFINRDRIDIYDIPISKITNDYLEHIKMMELMDIDVAAEFIYMSTVLLQIKARMLLPKAMGEDGEEIEDPRVDLVHRILDYKRFKNASRDLGNQYESHQKKFIKGMSMSYRPSYDISLLITEQVKLFDLAQTFKNILDSLPENNELDLVADKIRIKDQIIFMKQILDEKGEFLLTSLIDKDSSRIYFIGLFLAILELVRENKISFKQTKTYSDIHISKVS
jgi:segregation and condensation protein A